MRLVNVPLVTFTTTPHRSLSPIDYSLFLLGVFGTLYRSSEIHRVPRKEHTHTFETNGKLLLLLRTRELHGERLARLIKRQHAALYVLDLATDALEARAEESERDFRMTECFPWTQMPTFNTHDHVH